MSDESATQAPPPPPPPPGDPAPAPRLRRSRSERVLLGVSGGIARYFDVDPVIPRLVFVALTLFGGSGILLYLIAWLVIPDETEDETAAMNVLRGGRRRGGRLLLVLAGILVVILVASSSLLWLPGVGNGIVLPLLILAAGIALLVWPTDAHRRWHERYDGDDWRAERDAVRDQVRQERDVWREQRRQWRHGYRRGVTPDPDTTPGTEPGEAGAPPPPPAGVPLAAPPPLPPPQPAPPPRPRSFLGPLGFAALLVFIGVSGFAEAVGWWSTSPATYLSGTLILLGAVLIVSAFAGRARGLIWLGALLLPIAWAVSAVDLTWYDGIGEETVTVVELEDLDAEYTWGIGQFIVDLSRLDLDGTEQAVEVGLTVGEVRVYVPDTFATEIRLDGELGSVIVEDRGLRANNDGNDVSLDRDVGDPAGGTLDLRVEVGLGEAEVVVCGTGGVPCP